MPAKIITVCNQKGGSGKTTISMQLAGTLARRGSKVLVVDADPQGTATRWAATAEDEQPFPATVVGLSAATGKLHREVEKMVGDYDAIIIDCPPAADSPIPRSALLIADVALVPVLPSPLDMWASAGILAVIEDAGKLNKTLKARIVVNQCEPRRNLTREVLDVLDEFNVDVAATRIGSRTAYRQSALYGQTVHDLGTKAAPAVAEIEALATEVLAILKPPRSTRR